MNKTEIKKVIIKIVLFTTTFNFALLNTTLTKKITNNSSIAYAASIDEIKLDGSVYNEESEYFQYCLNKLVYKDDTNSALDTDGHFGNKSKSALNKFNGCDI